MTLKRADLLAAPAVACLVILTLVGTAPAQWLGVTPRTPVPKTPTAQLRMPDLPTGRLVVKFRDDVKARAMPSGAITSAVAVPMLSAWEVFQDFGLTATPAIDKSEEDLARLEARAAAYSGKAQPDLAGIVHVTGPEDRLLAAAKALNDLDSVEWVVIEQEMFPGGAAPAPPSKQGGGRRGGAASGGAEGPPNGACCLTDGTCTLDTQANCTGAGGTWQGAATDCVLTVCGACCLDDATCAGDTLTGCNTAGGVWEGAATSCAVVACGACCLDNGSCFVTSATSCDTAGGLYKGDGTDCMMADACAGACCMDVMGAPCMLADTQAACSGAGGMWQGPLIDCAMARCGGCCLPAGGGSFSCIVTGQTECSTIGSYMGVGLVCNGAGCGACCLASGACQLPRSMEWCTTVPAGATYAGDDTDCTDCETITGSACCLTDSTCTTVTSAAECVQLGGTFFLGLPCQPDFVFVDCRIRKCCLADDSCVLLREDQCLAQGGNWDAGTATCEDQECQNDCGDPSVGNCFDPNGNGSAFCSDQTCCNLICQIDPYCCDIDNGGIWDEICAAEANLNCPNHVPHCQPPPTGDFAGPDRCDSPLNAGCFEPGGNGSQGCNNKDCCHAVCEIDPFCCDFAWTAGCTELALGICTNPTPPTGPTPDYEALQGYLTATPYDPLSIPPDLKPYLPLIQGPGFDSCNPPPIQPVETPYRGYNGAGYNLVVPGEEFTDTNGNGWWDAGEPFEDRGNGTWDAPEPLTLDNNGNGVWDPAETFTDFNGNGVWDPGEPLDDQNGNGVWDDEDQYTDLNGNEQWDVGESFDDDGLDRIPNTFDPGEGDATWQSYEPLTDYNGNGTWDPGEPFSDIGGDRVAGTGDPGEANGVWDQGEAWDDTGNLVWDAPYGLWGIAQDLLLNPEHLVDGTGQGNLTRGKTTRVGVIEWGYYEGHEDLDVITEPGQSLIEIPSITSPDHGTATLSIINAIDNGIGVTGIVPEAEAWFFPLTSVEEGPRQMSAWVNAIERFGPGDVLSASYGPPPINLNCVQSTWTLFRLASDLGITVCVAAGNSCFNLDNATDLGDSGAIVCGACSPGQPYYRLAFSNYCTFDDPAAALLRGNIVHLKAWGANVGAAGYGVLPFADGDVNRTYTPTFGGTSAAAPQIAGMVAALQGLAKQFYGIPLLPEQIRSVMGAPGIPPANPARLFGGFPPGGNCSLDLDPDEGPNMIGVYPSGSGDAVTMLGQSGFGFDGAPNVDDVVIVLGTNVYGNRFAIKQRENLYLNVDAVYHDRNQHPNQLQGVGIGGGALGGSIVPEIASLDYIASGDMTDIVVVGHTELPEVGTMIIESEIRYPNVFTIMMVEAYDWAAHDWAFVDLVTGAAQAVGIDPVTGDLVFNHATSAPGRFVRASDGRMLVRFWTLGFPAFSGFYQGGDTAYTMRYDLVNIVVAEDFGVPLP